jgi:hypothetical protein
MRRTGIVLGVVLCLAAPSGSVFGAPSVYEPGLDPKLGFNLVSWAGATGTAADWENAVQGVYDLGVRHVSLVTYRFVDSTSGGISATSAFGLAPPPDDTFLAAAMAKAQTLGMTVSLNPFVEVDNASGIGHVWRGGLNFAEPTLGTFFTNYQNYISSAAALTQAGGAERLYVGSELKTLANNVAAQGYWTSVIGAADAAFGGNLSYAANHDEYTAVPFWSQLDEIGIDAYLSLATAAQATGVGNPSVNTIKANWAALLTGIEAFAAGKGMPVVFSEWGCVPYDLTTYETWNWNPSGTADPQEQLNAYIATVEAGDLQGDWLKAVEFWHWAMVGNEGSRYGITADLPPGEYIHNYVPEPATLGLLVVGMAVLGRRLRRPRRA